MELEGNAFQAYEDSERQATQIFLRADSRVRCVCTILITLPLYGSPKLYVPKTPQYNTPVYMCIGVLLLLICEMQLFFFGKVLCLSGNSSPNWAITVHISMAHTIDYDQKTFHRTI